MLTLLKTIIKTAVLKCASEKHQTSHMALLDSFRKVCRRIDGPEPIAPAPLLLLGVPKIRKIGPRFGMARPRKQGWGAGDLRVSIKHRTWHGWTASGRFVAESMGQNPPRWPHCLLGVPKIYFRYNTRRGT